jgi:hypothetical protein
MSFFGDEPAGRPARPPAPAWVAPPEHVLGVGVALNVVVARGESALIAVTDALAYPDGVVLGVLALRREAARHRGLVPRGGAFGGDHPGDARFGVGFPDGRRALAGRPAGGGEPGIALTLQGGGATEWRAGARLYLWPLPPPGALTFAAAWEALGLPETTVVIDAAPLREAAGRATVLWEAPGSA